VVWAADETLVAAVADLDAVAEFPSLLRARAFLAVAQAATSLLSGTAPSVLLVAQA